MIEKTHIVTEIKGLLGGRVHIEFPLNSKTANVAIVRRDETLKMGCCAADIGYFAYFLVWKRKNGIPCYQYLAGSPKRGGDWLLKNGSFKKTGHLIKFVFVQYGEDERTHYARKQVDYPSLMRSSKANVREGADYVKMMTPLREVLREYI